MELHLGNNTYMMTISLIFFSLNKKKRGDRSSVIYMCTFFGWLLCHTPVDGLSCEEKYAIISGSDVHRMHFAHKSVFN